MSRADEKKVPLDSPAHRIRVLMEARQLKPPELSATLKVSRQTISDWRNGHGVPRGKNLANLAKELRTTAGHILFGESAASSDDVSQVPRDTPLGPDEARLRADGFRDRLELVRTQIRAGVPPDPAVLERLRADIRWTISYGAQSEEKLEEAVQDIIGGVIPEAGKMTDSQSKASNGRED